MVIFMGILMGVLGGLYGDCMGIFSIYGAFMVILQGVLVFLEFLGRLYGDFMMIL